MYVYPMPTALRERYQHVKEAENVCALSHAAANICRTNILLLLLLLTAIGLSPGGSGYFTCTQI